MTKIKPLKELRNDLRPSTNKNQPFFIQGKHASPLFFAFLKQKPKLKHRIINTNEKHKRKITPFKNKTL